MGAVRRGSHQHKRGLWTDEEDQILMKYIEVHGKGQWNRIAKRTGLNRCGKSCRLRWINYLSPDVKRGDFSEEEDDLIIRLHKLLGNRWALIAGRIPGRTDNQVKNYWNTHLSRPNGSAKRQRTELNLPSLDTNKPLESKDSTQTMTATENTELKNTYFPMKNNNLIIDTPFSVNADTLFPTDEKHVTWKDELEQQMSIYLNLMQDSDDFLRYDSGWNNNTASSRFFD